MKTDLFQSCGHCWVFQTCWHTECSTFTASSFRIWNSSTGILSSPLALSTVVFPNPTWLHIPGCLAQGEWSYHCGLTSHEDLFWIILLCHILISSASVRSIPFLSFFVPIFAWNVGISNFLEEISSLFHFVIFLYFFALITEEDFISPCYSLELCIQMGISLLFSFAFSFSSFLSYL